ncbi:MAG: lysophospholipid acyltransferase family protein [Chitinophagales bacterium]|nr:lysophospholipid acyltransferase family protein [Chitinophagales bacterium]
MQVVAYYLALPFIYLISILPFPVLYLFSDLLFTVIYHIIGYRTAVVYQNLRNAFPSKSEQEITTIAREFYQHFCDLLMESIKSLTISKKEIINRCQFAPGSMAVFNNFFSEGVNVIALMGHYGNWEWAGLSMSSQSPYQLNVVYRPLTNHNFDKLIYNLRSRFGARPLPMNSAIRKMLSNKSTLSTTVFIADQTPPRETELWMKFLNQDTPVFQGAELIAAKLKYPAVYAGVKKIKRGYYYIYIETLDNHPEQLPKAALTQLFNQRLEKDIIEKPATWLWSHRRWKHKRNVPVSTL